jgi:hypothetical protein
LNTLKQLLVCVSCEKKIIVPVQLCVLSTGFVKLDPQVSAICGSFPGLFPNQIKECDTIENCGEVSSSDTGDVCDDICDVLEDDRPHRPRRR